LFDILKVALPAEEAHSALDKILAGGFLVILFDVLYPEQLRQIGGLIDAYASAEQPLFSVGSSAIEMALGAHWASTGWLEPRTQWSDAGGVDRLLIASGSCSPVTGQQIKRALADGFAEVVIDTTALVAENDTTNIIHQATRAAVERLKHGQSVIVHTSIGDADSRVAATNNEFSRRGLSPLDAKIAGARLFGWALGQVVRDAVEQTGVGRVVFAGGDTSSHAAQALQIEALEMIAPLAPGAPLCKAHAPGAAAGGLELVFKGGQVGAANFFTEASNKRSPPLSRATE
jgi:uncharacterized protein YgbK (DUF1537 family)